jgi:hypothetical protein
MMSQAEIRRRARYMAAEMIVSDVEAGMDIAGYTQDGSEEETAALTEALLRVSDMLRRRLPPGYAIDPGISNGSARQEGARDDRISPGRPGDGGGA